MITLCRKVQEYKTYYANGNILFIYYINKYGQYHNLYGPAYIVYYENGNKTCEGYYINGKLHRKDGPAYIAYYKNKNKKYEEYYIDGIEYTYEEWLERASNNDNTL